VKGKREERERESIFSIEKSVDFTMKRKENTK
jgi:hypothetical protein